MPPGRSGYYNYPGECRNVAGIDVLPVSPLTLHFEDINLIVADLSLY